MVECNLPKVDVAGSSPVFRFFKFLGLKMKKERCFIFFAIFVMIIGFIIRIKLFLSGRALWHDECSLAINILNKNPFQYLTPLEHGQSAPPIFMELTKIITYIFKTNEYSLRCIPLLSSLASIPIFFFIALKIFKNKYTQIISTFLFAINYQLIYYSQEFKQYSSDVLITLLCIYLLADIDLKKLSLKKSFIYSIIFSIIPLISFPATFVLIAFIIIQIIKNKKDIIKQTLIISIFPIISAILYTITTVLNTNSNMDFLKDYFKTSGFLGINPLSWLINLKINYNYFFYPNKLLLFAIILTAIGFVLIIKNKRNNTQNLLLGTLCTSILFSFFQIYPMFERTSLYLIPAIIFIILTPFDYIQKNKPIKTISTIFITFIFFISYTPTYINNLFKINTFTNEYAKEAMKEIISQYSYNDIIVYNTASDSEYSFYTQYFNFLPGNNIRINIQTTDQQKYNSILNQLPSNQTYWFYFPYSLSKYPENSMLKNWSQNKTVLFEKKYKSSLIMKVKL